MADGPEFTAVKSSNVAEVAYHEGGTVVRFKNGDTWRYDGVPESIHTEMLHSGSVGKYIHQFLKPNHKATKL